jgi:hypothetical protein
VSGVLSLLPQGASLAAPPLFEICDAINCEHRAYVRLEETHVAELRVLFSSRPGDAPAERATIAAAIALLERVAGAQTFQMSLRLICRLRSVGDKPHLALGDQQSSINGKQ